MLCEKDFPSIWSELPQVQCVATAHSYIVCHCQEELGSNIFLIALEVGVGAARLPLSLLFARLNKPSSLSPPQPLLVGYEP